MNKKRGLTIMEVVVAMAIVVIVSIMAFSTCSFAISLGNQNKIKNFFISETANYVKCYYLGSSKYAEGMELLTGTSYAYGENADIYYSKDFEISSEDDSKYVAKLIFTEDGFSVECYNNAKIVYEFEV